MGCGRCSLRWPGRSRPSLSRTSGSRSTRASGCTSSRWRSATARRARRSKGTTSVSNTELLSHISTPVRFLSLCSAAHADACAPSDRGNVQEDPQAATLGHQTRLCLRWRRTSAQEANYRTVLSLSLFSLSLAPVSILHPSLAHPRSALTGGTQAKKRRSRERSRQDGSATLVGPVEEPCGRERSREVMLTALVELGICSH